MIPTGLQSFAFHEGTPRFVPASMDGMGESLGQSFAQQLAHFQENNGAFSQERDSQTSPDTLKKTMSKDLPDIEAVLEMFRDWVRSFPESDTFFGDIDWENVRMMAEEALSENKEESPPSFDFETIAASIIEARLSISEMFETIFTDSQEVPAVNEDPSAFAEEWKEAGLTPLMALIAFGAEKVENAKPIRDQFVQYVQQWYPSAGREVGTQIYRDFSGHTKESGETTEVASRLYPFDPSHAAVKMETVLPTLNNGNPPSPVFVFNETMAMQALNKGEQFHIHIGDQKTEHARAMAFMKQFQQALSKGHLRSDGEGRQQLTIKLYPENLGRLDVHITRDNGVLQARLVTTTAMARELVESQLTNLRHAFHQQQLPVERIVVDQAHTEVADERREGNHSADEDASAYDKESDGERDGEDLPSFEEWLQATLNQKA